MAKNTCMGTPRIKRGHTELLSLYNRTPKKDMDTKKDLLEITGMKKETIKPPPRSPGRSKTMSSNSSSKSSTGSNKSTSPDTGIASMSSNNSMLSLNTSTRSNKSDASSEKSLILSPRSVFKAEERPTSQGSYTTIDTAMSMRNDNLHNITPPLAPYSQLASTDRDTISSFSIRTDISTATTIDLDFLQEEVVRAKPGQITSLQSRPKAAKGSRQITTSKK